MIKDYYIWLTNNNNALYTFITVFIISGITFLLVYFYIFIDTIIDKFKTIDKLLCRVEKLEKNKKKED